LTAKTSEKLVVLDPEEIELGDSQPINANDDQLPAGMLALGELVSNYG
jgi:hypothetical protein